MNRTVLKVIRFAIYSIELILLYVFQNIPIFNLRLVGVKPLLLIPAFITICIFENEFAGLCFGIFTGLLLDLAIGNVLGPQILVFGLLGYLIGIFTTRVFTKGILSTLSVGAFITPITVIFNFYLKYFFQSFEFTFYSFYKVILPCIVYTFILVVPAFLINRVICYFFSYFSVKNRQFIKDQNSNQR